LEWWLFWLGNRVSLSDKIATSTTLPTLDELLGRPEYPFDGLVDHYISLIKPGQLNVFTLHAELEGMKYLGWFDAFLKACLAKGIQLSPLESMAVELLKNKETIATLPLVHGAVDGRSGTLAVHGDCCPPHEMA
jgi:hypothetical protein